MFLNVVTLFGAFPHFPTFVPVGGFYDLAVPLAAEGQNLPPRLAVVTSERTGSVGLGNFKHRVAKYNVRLNTAFN